MLLFMIRKLTLMFILLSIRQMSVRDFLLIMVLKKSAANLLTIFMQMNFTIYTNSRLTCGIY